MPHILRLSWYGAFSLLLLGPSFRCLAQGDEPDSHGLGDISSVGVPVERLPPETGLSIDDVRAQVELSLRRTGIRVVPMDNRPTYVYVNITGMCPPANISSVCAGHVAIEFVQGVILERDTKGIPIVGSTFNSGRMVMSNRNTFADWLLDGLRKQIDIFLNEFLKFNHR